jgi:transcriptional regulator with XRE-family HTH domain
MIPYLMGRLEARHLIAIRNKLRLPQEQMARLLGVSFVTVNRWEGARSSPHGPALDLYLALNAAMRPRHSLTWRVPAIIRAANGERGAFLYSLFRMAYGPPKKSCAR